MENETTKTQNFHAINGSFSGGEETFPIRGDFGLQDDDDNDDEDDEDDESDGVYGLFCFCCVENGRVCCDTCAEDGLTCSARKLLNHRLTDDDCRHFVHWENRGVLERPEDRLFAFRNLRMGKHKHIVPVAIPILSSHHPDSLFALSRRNTRSISTWNRLSGG